MLKTSFHRDRCEERAVSEGNGGQSAIRCEKLLATLRDSRRQLEQVQLELTELKRIGPREELASLNEHRVALEHELERVCCWYPVALKFGAVLCKLEQS